MRKPVVLITGACGEIGHGLVEHFGLLGDREIITLDLRAFNSPTLRDYCSANIVGNILDESLLNRLISEYEIHTIYHLAALLSTRAEYTPEEAHRVNVNGTLNLLKMAAEQSRWHGHQVKFLFPSSIAVYGLPDLQTKNAAAPLKETQWNLPRTMYGCNKLYCEQVGRYFTLHYRQLAADANQSGVDFRSLRFPGLISATTLPSGGTSDFVPEMIHAAAKGEAYDCFVESPATIPFMAMPDAIRALVQLESAPKASLSQRVYNVTAFSPSAGEVKKRILRAFPDARIDFVPDAPRAGIVDSWPARVDDSAARSDWGFSPEFDFERAFGEYLIPTIRDHYGRA